MITLIRKWCRGRVEPDVKVPQNSKHRPNSTLALLCFRCREVLQRLPLIDDDDDDSVVKGKDLGVGLDTLLSGFRERCYICFAICDELGFNVHMVLDTQEPIHMDIQYQLDIEHADTTHGDILELQVDATLNITGQNEPWTTSKLFVLHDASKVEKRIRNLTSESTESEESLRIALHWVRECKETHERCRKKQQEENWYPTRLIDLGDYTNGRVKLLQNPKFNMCEKPSFVTLSHCWGSKDFLKLRTSNQKDFENGIKIRDLPKSFQEAMTITHRLGFQYIWIDSLCIVQDTVLDTDWQHEAAMMDKTYTHASLNIAATFAEDSSKGLFSERCLETLNPPLIELCQIGNTPRQYRIVDNGMWTAEIEDAPLMGRAWVLQERLLAKRVLHFGRRQLVWECCQNDAMEILPDGFLPGRNPMSDKLKRFGPAEGLDQDVDHSAESQFPKQIRPFIAWTHIVETYSEAHLSFARDKLVALGGVAKRLSATTQCEYTAGLWRTFIENQLLWHVANPQNTKSIDQVPSWSWASIDGPVCQPLSWKSDAIIATVKEVHVTHQTEYPFGMVFGGYLSLRGLVKPITLGEHNGAFSSSSLEIKSVHEHDINPADEDVCEDPDPEVRLDCITLTKSGSEAFFCVPIYHDQSQHELRGLVLCFQDKGGTYKRIGTFWSWNPRIITMMIDEQPPCSSGGEQEDKGQRTIIIT